MHALWGVMAVSLGAPAAVYLLQPPKARAQDEWIEIGDVAQLSSGQPLEMVFQHNHTDGWKTVGEKLSAWVVKTPEGGVVAFGPRCTHLGCAHRWDEGKKHFVCPCHNSLFSIDGKVLAGPASRPLDRYETKMEGNKLLVGSLRRCSENAA